MDDLDNSLKIWQLENSIYGKALIVYRNIGMPTFGWCDDEI